jgi:hypothetical protein
MNEALASIFDESAKAPGALGCGVRLPDRTSRVRSFSRECPDESIEKVLLHLAGTVAFLSSQDLVGHHLRWTFAGGKLHVAIRNDGALFCILARKDAGQTEFFEHLLGKFLATT